MTEKGPSTLGDEVLVDEAYWRGVADARKAVAKALWGSRDAHGGVPFASKGYWHEGYSEAKRAVLHGLDAMPHDAAAKGSS